jgi:hypothetical protein
MPKQPVTARRRASIGDDGSISSTSITRLTAQAHATIAPAG